MIPRILAFLLLGLLTIGWVAVFLLMLVVSVGGWMFSLP